MIKNIRKWYKIPNEQPAFGCQPAFGSHSQSLTNKLFSSFFFVRLTWASCMCAWWKRYFFIIFQCLSLFLTMQTHAQACIRWSKYTTYFLPLFVLCCGSPFYLTLELFTYLNLSRIWYVRNQLRNIVTCRKNNVRFFCQFFVRQRPLDESIFESNHFYRFVFTQPLVQLNLTLKRKVLSV